MTKKALLDACTIFGMPIRDTLFTAAFQGVFQLYLSEDILDEVSRNRIKKQLSTPEREDHFQQQVRKAFPQSFVDAPLDLIDSMTNDPKDRHVLAAAIVAGVDYLVTYNLKDFPVRSYRDYNLSVLHPDDFLLSLCDDCGDEALINVLEEQSRNLKKTSISSLQILDKLRINRCNKFADRLYRAIEDRYSL
jgi:predicted nucleic acid-binding protein